MAAHKKENGTDLQVNNVVEAAENALPQNKATESAVSPAMNAQDLPAATETGTSAASRKTMKKLTGNKPVDEEKKNVSKIMGKKKTKYRR